MYQAYCGTVPGFSLGLGLRVKLRDETWVQDVPGPKRPDPRLMVRVKIYAIMRLLLVV